MKQHTPGPWDFQNQGDLYDESGRVVIVDADQTSLAELEDLSEVSYANARLIAAAPAQNDALKVALRWLLDSNPAIGEYDKVVETIEAAIALATSGKDGTP